MSPESLLPNCLIIGAAKAGTTSLFRILTSHPQVFGSPVKETGFFSNDERYKKGLPWYETTYFGRANGFAIRTEASPAYLTWSDKVAPRVRQAYEGRELKLVAILRDPVKRAYSHYWHRVRLGHESLPFSEALAREDTRVKRDWDALYQAGNGKYGYFRAGCYATRIRPFLEHFDRNRLSFLLQDDLQAAHFQAAIRRLLAFLDIDETVGLEAARVNTPTRTRHRALARMYWGLKKTFVQRLYTDHVPARLRRQIGAALFPPADYPPMAVEIEQLLRARYADEVKECEDLIQRDLSHWLPS